MITTTFSGDTCCFPFSLGGFKKFLEAELGVYVKSLEIGNSIVTDYKSGYLIHPNRQVGWNFLVRAFFFCFIVTRSSKHDSEGVASGRCVAG